MIALVLTRSNNYYDAQDIIR